MTKEERIKQLENAIRILEKDELAIKSVDSALTSESPLKGNFVSMRGNIDEKKAELAQLRAM